VRFIASASPKPGGGGYKQFLFFDTFKIPFSEICIDQSFYYLPSFASNRPAVKAFLAKRQYEPATHCFVSQYLAIFPGSIVHAGAFFGDMLPSFSKATSASIYAFEPCLESFVLSKLCVEKNSLTNVLLYNAGLTDRNENLRINTLDLNSHHAGGASSIAANGLLVAGMTIDSLNAADITLIHLDVEGSEFRALCGARQTILSCKPVILIEDNADNSSELLIDCGYLYVDRIPGVKIWCPIEGEKSKNFILNFMTNFRGVANE
jgi:FkbM family methyltransferase